VDGMDKPPACPPRPRGRTKAEEADKSRATKTGQLHSLSTEKVGSYGDSCWPPVWGSALDASLVMAGLALGSEAAPEEFAASGRLSSLLPVYGEKVRMRGGPRVWQGWSPARVAIPIDNPRWSAARPRSWRSSVSLEAVPYRWNALRHRSRRWAFAPPLTLPSPRKRGEGYALPGHDAFRAAAGHHPDFGTHLTNSYRYKSQKSGDRKSRATCWSGEFRSPSGGPA
jgi:hypothetical protein